ncbi:MAG: hypothetical protein JNJ77_17350 [Planctomycetia bacterium]|nr:hypothetical protein [Planctomycetia bacterium]
MRVNHRIAAHCRFQPRLETLEDRQVPAVNIWQQGATLFVQGTGGTDQINIQDMGNGNFNVQVDNKFGVNYSGLDRIRVRTHGGDDTVNYSVDNKSMATPKFRMDVDLGSGNDNFDADIYGYDNTTNAAAPMEPCDFEFNVEGGSGSDDIYMGFFADLHSGDSLRVRFNGQSGDDYAGFRFGGSNYRGELHADIYGGSGHDNVSAVLGSYSSQGYNSGTIQFDVGGESGNDNVFFGFENFNDGNGEVSEVQPNGYTYENRGELKVRMRGGSGNDNLEIGVGEYSSLFNSGQVKYAIDGGAGRDNITVGASDMMNSSVASSSSAPLVNNGYIDLSVEGGSSKDNIRVDTLLAADTADAYFRVRVKGEGNSDNIRLAAYRYNNILGTALAQVKAGPMDYLWITPNVDLQGARSSRITYLPM